MFATGCFLLAGGSWWIGQGGSWYYASAGAAFITGATLLFRREKPAVWLYICLFSGTWAWALWRLDFEKWAMPPQIAILAVLLALLALTLPLLKPRASRASILAALLPLIAFGVGLSERPQAEEAEELRPVQHSVLHVDRPPSI